MEKRMARWGMLVAFALTYILMGKLLPDLQSGIPGILTIVAIVSGFVGVAALAKYEAPHLRWVFYLVGVIWLVGVVDIATNFQDFDDWYTEISAWINDYPGL